MRQKVDVNQLVPGMYVADIDRPWLETDLLFQGFPIVDQEDIEQLKRWCQFVYVDTRQAVQLKTDQTTLRTLPPITRFKTSGLNLHPEIRETPPPDHKRLLRDIQQIKSTYDDTRDYIRDVLEDVRLGNTVNTAEARQLVGVLANSIVMNDSALVWLSQLKSRDEYTVHHSINVCVLSLLLGKQLGLPEPGLNHLGLGALLHDIGKMRIPLEILNKQDALSEEERQMVQQHPVLGYEILKKDHLPQPVLDVVLLHHERQNGNGYPQGLKGEHIPLYPSITSIVDVYDAMTTRRIYHNAISPHEALKLMYEKEKNRFRSDLLDLFIRSLSIFPIGSIVELSNGEVGVVVSVNPGNHLLPVVLLVLDCGKIALPRKKLCNLDLLNRTGTLVRVKTILESDAYGLDVSAILQTDGDLKQVELPTA